MGCRIISSCWLDGLKNMASCWPDVDISMRFGKEVLMVLKKNVFFTIGFEGFNHLSPDVGPR